MIQEGKLLRVMTPEETVEWIQAWAAWRDREYAVLCSVGGAFNAAQVESIERGLSLMTAFQFTHEFVRHRRMFHDYSRAMGRMQFYMELISKELSALSLPESTAPSAPRRRGRPTKEEAAQMAREKAEREEREAVANLVAGKSRVAAAVAGSLFPDMPESPESPERATANSQEPKAKSLSPATPDAGLAAAMAVYEQSGVRLHLDQLAWLMSEGLRQRVGTVASLRSKAAEESNQAKALAERGVAQEIIEPHSRAAVEATTAYKEIYADVDRELGNLYSLLSIGGEHIPAWEERCRAKGITVSQLMAVLKPYWEKAGKPVVSLESVTTPSPEEETEKKARAARLHAIRTFFIRKDRKLTAERVEKMRAYIEEVRGYGLATDEYELILEQSAIALTKQADSPEMPDSPERG